MHFYINFLCLNLIVVLNTIIGYIKKKSMYFREKYHLFCTAYKYGVFKRELQYLINIISWKRDPEMLIPFTTKALSI